MTSPKQNPRPAKTPTTDRDALPQGAPPAGAPPTEERSYEDGQDAAFDPRGDRAHDKAPKGSK